LETVETQAGNEPEPVTRRFPAGNSCGGLVASVGVLFLTGAAFLTTLPGSTTAGLYPVWLAWTLRLAPLPALLLLWAVVVEADYKVKTDGGAIYFRHGLGGVTRLPWGELRDFFADCGRGVHEVAEEGGSLTAGSQEPGVRSREKGNGVAAEAAPTREGPFAIYKPDYTLAFDRGMFVFTDTLAYVGRLAAEVVARAPEGAPDRWEEASWLTCGRCKQRLAASVWPPAEDDREAELLGPFACPMCGESLESLLAKGKQALVVELRGTVRRRFAWRPPAPPEETPAIVPEDTTGLEPRPEGTDLPYLPAPQEAGPANGGGSVPAAPEDAASGSEGAPEREARPAAEVREGASTEEPPDETG